MTTSLTQRVKGRIPQIGKIAAGFALAAGIGLLAPAAMAQGHGGGYGGGYRGGWGGYRGGWGWGGIGIGGYAYYPGYAYPPYAYRAYSPYPYGYPYAAAPGVVYAPG